MLLVFALYNTSEKRFSKSGVINEFGLTDKDVDDMRNAFISSNHKQVIVLIGGNGAVNVNLPALRDSNCAIVVIQAITDNGGRTGQQEVELRPGKGRTIGLGDEMGAISEGFLTDQEYMARKLYSNFNTNPKDANNPLSLEESILYIINSGKAPGLEKEKGFISFIIEQLNMARIIDTDFSATQFADVSDRAKVYKTDGKQFSFFGKSIRNLNGLAVFHELGAMLDLVDGGNMDVNQAKVAMYLLERAWGVELKFHVVPSALASAMLEATYERAMTGKERKDLEKKVRPLGNCLIKNDGYYKPILRGQQFIDQYVMNLSDFLVQKSKCFRLRLNLHTQKNLH